MKRNATEGAAVNVDQIPPARRGMLEAMNAAQLDAELAEIRAALDIHVPHVNTCLRARLATEALRTSEAYVLAVAGSFVD